MHFALIEQWVVALSAEKTRLVVDQPGLRSGLGQLWVRSVERMILSFPRPCGDSPSLGGSRGRTHPSPSLYSPDCIGRGVRLREIDRVPVIGALHDFVDASID